MPLPDVSGESKTNRKAAEDGPGETCCLESVGEKKSSLQAEEVQKLVG